MTEVSSEGRNGSVAPARDHGPETQPEPMWVEAVVTPSVLIRNCFLSMPQRSSEAPGHAPEPKFRIDETSHLLQSGPGDFVFYFILLFKYI